VSLDIIIRGGTVVSGAGLSRADVGIVGESVATVGDLSAQTAKRTIDATDLLVLPGVVDEHVHPVYLDDPAYISEVALYGGVTTMMHFAYAHPGESLLERVEDLRARSTRGAVDFTIHATMFDPANQISELPAVAATGVRTFKVFRAYQAQGWMTDDSNFVRVLRAVRDVDGLLLVHCENGSAIDLLEQDAAAGRLGDDPVLVVGRTRPPGLEAESVASTIALAAEFDTPLLVVHITSEHALEAFAYARRRSSGVIGETCPQYLLLTADAMREFGGLAKIGPPLRTARDCEALWEGIANGTIQTIGSDHVPKKTPADRDIPLLEAGFGAPSIETSLAVIYDAGVASGRISIERLVQIMSENPAKVFGLYPRKGAIRTGSDADMILWNPAARRRLGAASEHTRAGYSLYEGREVSGAPTAVISRGQVMVEDNQLVGEHHRGRFLATGPFDMRAGHPADAAPAGGPRR
jgi:dihydropyrimidinase